MAIASLAMVDDYRMATALQHQQAGRLAEAEQLYRAIIAETPDDPQPWHYLGMIDHLRGRHDQAAAWLAKALALQPADSELLAHLALVEHARGQASKAIALLEEAIRRNPRNGEAETNLGIFAASRGDGATALAALSRAAALDPASADAEIRLAMACRQFNRPEEARAAAERAVAKQPDHARALDTLGLMRRDAGAVEEAAVLHRRATAIEPGFAGGWNNLGNTLARMGDGPGAIAALERAVALEPGFGQAWLNLARTLLNEGKLTTAKTACARGVALLPRDPDGACLAGDIARAEEEFGDALAIYEKALAAGIDQQGALLGRLCETALAAGRWDALAPARASTLELVRSGASQRISPFVLLCLADDPQLQQKGARAFSQARRREIEALDSSFSYGRGERRKLRIGYLSADYRDHATVQLLVEVIEKHDRRAVEVVGYDIGAADNSPLRHRIVAAFDRFVEIGAIPALDAARRINRDGVDILVDLKGYTDGARPDILALRPAPIQAAWLGYPGTSGAPFIDYVIADSFVAPAGSDGDFSEAIVRLPRCYQPADSRLEVLAQTPSKPSEGLPEEGIVFCCFNNGFKLNPDIFDVWLALLRSCPRSVLWLLASNKGLPAQLRAYAGRAGISPERLVFAPRVERPLHLARHRLADLFLDTAPYGAHTTASDALRLGIPVITCPGRSFASRVAGSLLHHLGIGALIAATLDEYEIIARELAQDPAKLAAMKARIAALLPASSLLDTPAFVKDLERAYGRMWQTWCRGARPASFTLETMRG